MTLRQAQGERVGVLGAGAWGTALAQMLASAVPQAPAPRTPTRSP